MCGECEHKRKREWRERKEERDKKKLSLWQFINRVGRRRAILDL